MLQSLWSDFRYGIRTLRRNPGFGAIAVLTLALGIGANTAIFSVVDAVLLRPLPYPEPDRLVFLWTTWTSQPGMTSGSALPDYREWRARTRSLEGLAGYNMQELVVSGTGMDAERVPAARVTANLLRVLHVSPARGRDFRDGEDVYGQHHVVLLSYGFWQRRFGGDPTIVDRAITIGNEPYTVVGILPEGLSLFANRPMPDVWTPIAYPTTFLDNRGNHFVTLVGRLAPGATMAQAQAEVSAIAQQMEVDFPENKGLGGRIVPAHDELTRDVRPALLILVGAVGFVLLIACANLANLLYARAATRQRELAIRASLGAPRGRLMRQLVIENIPIAILGGAAALAIAQWSLSGMRTLLPPSLPRLHAIDLNGRVFAFTAALSLATALLFSMMPAWQAVRRSVTEALNDGGRGGTGGVRHTRMRGTLIVVETAFALILLVGAGLMVRTFLKLRDVDPGFAREHVLVMRIPLPDWKYPGEQFDPTNPNPPAGLAFYQRIAERVRALPGVQAAGFTTRLPLGFGMGWGKNLSFEGQPRLASTAEVPLIRFGFVSPGYMESVGIRLRRGRTFDERDTMTSQPVAIINETLARRYFPNQDPIGRWLMTRPPEYLLKPENPGDRGVHRIIVGVIADVKDQDFSGAPNAEVYGPWTQTASEGWNNSLTLSLRTTTPPAGAFAAVREQIHQLDPEQPIADMSTMSELADRRLSQPRFSTLLLGLFATLAVVLAGVGLFGLLSHLVTLRTQELGIRLALGAERGDLLRLVIGQGLRLTLLGLIVGLGGALALGPLLRAQLFGVEPTDAMTLVTVALGLLGVAAVACYLPARRATRVDPMIALRQG